MKLIGRINGLYPMPMAVVGTVVNEKVNFIPVAHLGILNLETVMIGLGNLHYSNIGIKEDRMFSLNMITEEQIQVTDYAGMVTGERIDKSNLFPVFYGSLKTVPLIANCPVAMECEVINIIEMSTHDIFIARIANTYADEKVLTNNRLDLTKIKPVLFDMSTKQYFGLGSPLAQCWSEGKKYIPK